MNRWDENPSVGRLALVAVIASAVGVTLGGISLAEPHPERFAAASSTEADATNETPTEPTEIEPTETPTEPTETPTEPTESEPTEIEPTEIEPTATPVEATPIEPETPTEAPTQLGTPSGTPTPAPAPTGATATPTGATATPTGATGAPELQRVRVAYIRCPGAEQEGRIPCPRDLELERQVWRAVAALPQCGTFGTRRGAADLRVHFRGLTSSPELRFREWGETPLDMSGVIACLRRPLADVRTSVDSEHLVISFRFRMR